MPCRWVPVQERSRSLALVYSGMYTGSILGLALSPHLIEVRYVRDAPPLLQGSNVTGMKILACCNELKADLGVRMIRSLFWMLRSVLWLDYPE